MYRVHFQAIDPTRADMYEKLVEEENIAHGGRSAGRTLLSLALEGIDLDSKWWVLLNQR